MAPLSQWAADLSHSPVDLSYGSYCAVTVEIYFEHSLWSKNVICACSSYGSYCLELQWYLQSLNIFWRWVYHLLCQCTKSEQSMQLIVFNITLVTFHLASVHSIRKQTKRNFMSSRSSFHPTGQNLFTAWVLLHLFQLTHMTGSSLSCLLTWSRHCLSPLVRLQQKKKRSCRYSTQNDT